MKQFTSVIQRTVVLCTVSTWLITSLWALDPAPCILHIDTLKIVDGTPLVDIVEIMKFKTKVGSMLKQQITPTCSFKDLVQLEQKLPVHDRAVALQRFITQFEKTAQPYLKDIHVACDIIKPCIAIWARQRQKLSTPLLILNTNEFQPGKEHALFVNKITSLKAFDQLLEDLHLFLTDFTASLPKSLAKYHAALLKVTPR
jgi:hypothetical protein